jgi:hypothetical protein
MLGMRNRDHSYVVGTGKGPKRPQDRAASCPLDFDVECNRWAALEQTCRSRVHVRTHIVVATAAASICSSALRRVQNTAAAAVFPYAMMKCCGCRC